ncbi:M-protein, striated muscle-like isoform X1 [Myxocyprinus asiaticus]|uniref:M-protein, striated muscle-like isoform X1 n=2 Tax=Myxocyprinus asiaticus TaxID=70543 RepID=UPI002223CF02|nr:M-protein, striated muscle-like isoform X1 [Myxocyprinus asiaticus]XP_051523761.1 M-protein, striated muscle-like isoform X1 [Myxocyprinus asiaticus]XP_051523848.1 M-protein, striated muscle-like isoform X1 [Myxocyprinus asiaticus]XP_051523937.1 M-protein, striated muscle-like isoform X1 [Myxocyprinus asiaticus]
MSGSLPFYQKHHRHYDRGYRSRETESAISQYQQSSSSYTKSTKGLRAATYTALDESRLSPLPKRAKPTYLAMDKENQIIGYVVPIFRGSREFESGLSDTEEVRAKESAGYLARRDLFSSGMESERTEHKSRRTIMRESAERISLSKRIHENEEYHKRLNEDSLMHTPEFVIRPRSHTVWEKQCVRLHCTISGWPEPRIVWYKNNVSIDPMANPGKYKVVSSYNVHSLEINRCDFDDTAQYRVSAMNSKGEISALASVVVKRFKGEIDESLPSPRLQNRKFGFEAPCLEYGVKFETHIVEKFGVSFGREGETLSLGCSVIIYPSLQRFQPEIEWYRDDKLLMPSKWVQTHWSGDRATLTLTHLNKEDEGLYTLRVITKSGFETHSAYVFVRDADADVAGAPCAPLDVYCQEANKDYVIVTWKQPAVDGGSAILGYFVDRCEVGTTHWAQCNDTPVKFARFPVTGLVEGRSYMFRVRAVNKAGMSRPSRVSEPVAAMDPADRARKGASAPWTGQIIVTEEEPVEGVVPGRPGELTVNEATKNYVVLSWKPPGEKGHEGVMYYVEKCVSGTDSWQRVNTDIPVKSPRFALFDLAEGKSYRFRVRCCNSAGVGEPSEPTEAITVGDKLDIPSAPGRVVPTRNTDTSVVVSWEASRDAKELVGYYIESSIAGSNTWEPCNNKPVKGTRFICHGLTTGERYVFHVRAVNAAGISECSQESEAIEVKAAIGGGIHHASPAPPFGITVLESVRDSMVLAWKQPTFIGGADITGYFVDYREVIGGVPGKWHEANIKSVSERAYRISELKENMLYQFQVRAANMAGVGIPSLPSDVFKCEEWTIAVPGPPHDLQIQEVRKDSLVLLWKPPVYQGRDAVNGYYIDIKEAEADFEMWRGVNEKATNKAFMKIKNLKEGESYVFRVRAQNKAGVGKASEQTEPVEAVTKPGTAEIVVNVDDDGVISLNFECSKLTADSKFVWSKNYKEMEETGCMTFETKGNKSKAIFNTPSEDDLGIYSCVVTHTDGVSASYTLTEEGLKDLLKISHEHKFPIIPLKTELAVELLEKGRVRFWLQAEKISANGKVEYVFNDNMISQGEKYKMNFDKNTGIIEMFIESLGKEDEGTFTFQLQDGKATNQSSLVLIGDVFKQLQKESEFQRKEWHRKQGPHFVEYLSYEVTPECCVRLKCKVGNMKKDSVALWYKDGREIKVSEKLDFSEGVLTLEITQISKKDAGIYEVVLKDDRGKDSSTLNLTDQGFKDLMNQVFSVIANSSTPLKIQSTEEGIRLYSFVSYYNDELHVTWHHKEAAIAFTERIKSGVVGEQLWLQISEPTEKDKGKYAIEFFDGKGGLRRTVELAGQAFDDAYAEFQRLKAAAIAERNRARVAGGLPDVVTIQEGKSLNLTCDIWGDPMPEVTWLKNEREMVSDDHYILKFESGKFASFTITSVNTADSGKYSILVKNKYGTESGDFTLKVTESMGDFGVISYLADVDGNVTVGPSTPASTCHSAKQAPPTPTPPKPKSATPIPKNQTPITPTPSTPVTPNPPTPISMTPIPKNPSPVTPNPPTPTSVTPIPQNPTPVTPNPPTPTSMTPVAQNRTPVTSNPPTSMTPIPQNPTPVTLTPESQTPATIPTAPTPQPSTPTPDKKSKNEAKDDKGKATMQKDSVNLNQPAEEGEAVEAATTEATPSVTSISDPAPEPNPEESTSVPETANEE